MDERDYTWNYGQKLKVVVDTSIPGKTFIRIVHPDVDWTDDEVYLAFDRRLWQHLYAPAEGPMSPMTVRLMLLVATLNAHRGALPEWMFN